MDNTDRKILALLQEDAAQPIADIARRVGLSVTPCWRRIQKLQEDGVIRARVALLDGPKTVAEINASLDVEPTLLSHHLRALREAGLVTRERQGRHASYALASALVERRKGRAIDLGCCTLSFS